MYRWNPNGVPLFWLEFWPAVLRGLPSEIEVIWVLGIHDFTY